MPRKRFAAEEIINKLREAEVRLPNGESVVEACKQQGVTEQTVYRWRREYGGLRIDQARRLKELERENGRLRHVVADRTLDVLYTAPADPERSGRGKLLSPARRRRCIDHVRSRLGVSERRVCRVPGQARATQRYQTTTPTGEAPVTTAVVQLAAEFGRYGYRRVTGLLRARGWRVNHTRVERIWRREGLTVPQRQPKRGRLWLRDGSCIRLRPLRQNHVWAYDFVFVRTQDGRLVKILTLIDEFTRECLALRSARRLGSDDVQQCLTELFTWRGVPRL